ncbi:RDD family protein [Aquimarina addita]|uniref:RDD family protein n=1 Tax=Aquimarina addita TaxID=870485 RepID=A0ABP6UR41_9FLAO
MANLAINTAQNVNLAYKTVSIGERMLAFFIDFFLIWLYVYIVSIITEALGYVFSDAWTVFGLQSLLFLPVMFYSLVMHMIFNGRTVGKMLLKIRVVKVDGLPVHWSNYLIRWTLRLVDIWMFMGSIGILSILFSEKHQRLGDAAAGTVVITTKQKVKISHTILEEVEDLYQPSFLTVSKLTDKDVRIIKETYLIAKKTNDFRTLTMLRNRVEEVLEIKSDLYDRQFIDTILKDYSYYTQTI